jgi:hypothetical protein
MALDSIKYVPAGNVLVRVAVFVPPVEVITVKDSPTVELDFLIAIIQTSNLKLYLYKQILILLDLRQL